MATLRIAKPRDPVSRAANRSVLRGFRVPHRGVLRGSELLRRTALPAPLPALIERAAQVSDELDVRVACAPFEEPFLQWNPVSGMWPLDTSAMYDAGGALLPRDDDGRAITTLRNRQAKLIYKLVHETGHMMLVELGLRGLFRSAGEARYVLLFSEMFAEFLSHYELGLASYGYWRDVWRPFAERSEGQLTNAGKAAWRAGLRRPADRAALIARAYFSNPEDPAPLAADDIVAAPELAAAWTMQRRYAIKSWSAVRTWERHYWGHPEMRDFIERFVPHGPAPVWIEGRKAPLEIGSVHEALAHFDRFARRWRAPPEPAAFQLRARRAVQRAAMAVAQSLRLVRYDGLCVSAAAAGALESAHVSALARLEQVYRDIERGEVTTRERAAGARAQASRMVRGLVRAARDAGGADAVCFAHPATRGMDMGDADTIDLRPLATLTWPQEPGAQRLAAGALARTLARVVGDLRCALRIAGDPPAVRRALLEAHGLGLRAELARDGSDDPALGDAIASWYRQALADGGLCQVYRWGWLAQRPFVDPLVGFRIR